MIVLDTNVVSEIVKTDHHRQVQVWLDSQPLDLLHTTAISLAEIMFGIEKLPEGRRKETLREGTRIIFDRYLFGRVLPFDEAAAHAYGKIIAAARAQGRAILVADGQIASVAQTRGAIVATRDTAPFEAAGIPVINPWAL